MKKIYLKPTTETTVVEENGICVVSNVGINKESVNAEGADVKEEYDCLHFSWE